MGQVKKLSKIAQRHLWHINFKGKNYRFSSLYPQYLAWSRCSNICQVTECLNQHIIKSGDRLEETSWWWSWVLLLSMKQLRHVRFKGHVFVLGTEISYSSFTQQTWVHVSREWVMTLHKEKLTKIQALRYREGILSKCCPWSSRWGRQTTCQWCVEGETRLGPRKVVQKPH